MGIFIDNIDIITPDIRAQLEERRVDLRIGRIITAFNRNSK